MLKLVFFAVFLGLSVATKAQTAQKVAVDARQVLETTDTEQTAGRSSFSLFQHGIWPRDVVDPKKTNADIPYQVARSSNAQRKFRLSRTVASRRAIYLPSIQAAERRHDLPAGLLDALVWQESRYNPLAVSSAGAGGLTQLMPATAAELGVKNRFDPSANVDGGARYLRQMLEKFGQIHLALAAYNAGPGAVSRARGIPRNGETPDYVRKVLGRWTESVR